MVIPGSLLSATHTLWASRPLDHPGEHFSATHARNKGGTVSMGNLVSPWPASTQLRRPCWHSPSRAFPFSTPFKVKFTAKCTNHQCTLESILIYANTPVTRDIPAKIESSSTTTHRRWLFRHSVPSTGTMSAYPRDPAPRRACSR